MKPDVKTRIYFKY